jgi:hypothetical protein
MGFGCVFLRGFARENAAFFANLQWSVVSDQWSEKTGLAA